MYQLEQTGKFKKDIKLAKKRGLDMRLLDEVVTQLVEKGSLPPKNKPHKLTGNYKGFWECHILPDWLLIWEQGYEFFLRSSLNCTAITNSSDIVFTSYTSSIAIVTSSLKMGKSSFVTKFISMKISIKLDATLHQLN